MARPSQVSEKVLPWNFAMCVLLYGDLEVWPYCVLRLLAEHIHSGAT